MPASSTGDPATPPKPRLLLAENENSAREFLREILLPYYEMTVVLNGAQAIDAARREPPDLVLSNVLMGEVDGVELTHWLRMNPPTVAVPIILLSADNRMDTIQRGLAAGANDYLLKPFRPHELLATVAKLLD